MAAKERPTEYKAVHNVMRNLCISSNTVKEIHFFSVVVTVTTIKINELINGF